ncbi:stealth conserved region 3 domain-containing protein [Pantoea eucrina]|uniref:stealth conserved region 3 domain-containing protein n=1 Tax=Pantoea eucrina TaxID=472693 RepID=UPI0028A0F707|nr:stealth conserved region 3 domain-containing protein [Pantoea eucrina]
MDKMIQEIDFIIPWVTSDDEEWQKDFKLNFKDDSGADARILRYRDNHLLKYWFRGIESFAPWVRKVHFVTYGHLPYWLNKNHKKLNIVRHEDYIDKKFLPTFNSHVIENNLHRITGLSEKFVYFNDDTFLINKIDDSFYFRDGYPNDCAILNAVTPGGLSHIILNDLEIINRHFSKNKVIKNNLRKWFNINYGVNLLRTICLLVWPSFIGIKDTHLPIPYLKKTFQEVWAAEGKLLDQTNNSKFRNLNDVNQYLFRYWQLASGSFIARNTMSDSIYMDISTNSIEQLKEALNDKRHKLLVINDGEVEDFELVTKSLDLMFSEKFPHKSAFEI